METSVEFKIRGYHVDLFGHVNHARYIEFLEEARWDYCEKNKLFDVFHDKQLMHVVVNININYKHPAPVGSILTIDTAVSKLGRKSVTFFQKIMNKEAGIEIADAEIANVFLDLATNQSIVVEERLLEDWEDLRTLNSD